MDRLTALESSAAAVVARAIRSGLWPARPLMVGTPDGPSPKSLLSHEVFRHDRTLMRISVGDQPQAAILRSIELLGSAVAPKVRAELALDASSRRPL